MYNEAIITLLSSSVTGGQGLIDSKEKRACNLVPGKICNTILLYILQLQLLPNVETFYFHF